MRRMPWTVATLASCVLLVGCSDDGATFPAPRVPNVVGAWTGTYTSNEGSFPASFTFTQADRVVGGTGQIIQKFERTEVTAAIDDFGNLVLLVENGCEEWFGSLGAFDGDQTLEGGLQVDRDGCEDPTSETGLLTLNR